LGEGVRFAGGGGWYWYGFVGECHEMFGGAECDEDVAGVDFAVDGVPGAKLFVAS
jgi:hypothetical protein